MKKVEIVCVGKIKERFYSDAIDEYSKRLKRYCELTIRELPDFATQSVRREGEKILTELGGHVILCDISGEQISSEEFADSLEKIYLTSPKIQFVIGGSHGVSSDVARRADTRISFGRMTYPHNLMRVILLEQLYRAFTITAGTSYHK